MIAPPGVHESNFPTIDASEPGHIAVGFPGSDSTRPSDPTRAWQYYMVVSANAGAPNPTFVSRSPQIPGTDSRIVHRGACSNRCGGMFDFLDIKIAPADGGRVWATLSDDCTGACVNDPKGASDNADVGLGFAVEQVAGPVLGPGR
jgi:hypothetical protein